jgi:hypothetical protein
LSRGSSPSGHPAEPLVSYQINRQFSGWILPPQVIRAFGAHCQQATSHACFEMKEVANWGGLGLTMPHIKRRANFSDNVAAN